jgi:hypothetical protein
MKKVITILFLLLFLHKLSFSQLDSLLKISLVKSIQGDIKDFTTDNLGNIYIITDQNQLKKFNQNGDSVSSFNDVRRYGHITSIDATNPLKVLVYYKDFSRLIVLDRLLNVRNAIDLRQQNIFQVKAYTSSYDNNIWLYDELESKLKKVDDNGKILLETNDFRQVFDSAPSPNSIFDKDGLVYLYDPFKGLSTFDYYGALKNNFQLRNITDLQVLDNNTITGRDSTHIILYKPSTLQLLSFRISSSLAGYKKIRFDGIRLYALDTMGAINIFSTQ